jgi:hypothetical protein
MRRYLRVEDELEEDAVFPVPEENGDDPEDACAV